MIWKAAAVRGWGPIETMRHSAALAVGLATLLLALPAGASASFLTFDNYALGTQITNQYQGEGILFSGSFGEVPEIASDVSNPTSPVLRGGEDFFEPLHAQFVYPGTATAATASGLSLDIGYIDDPGSTQLVVNTTTGPITVLAEEFGINSLSVPANNITGFDVEAVEEDAGIGIDNLSFTVAPPPPPPPAPPPPAASPKCPKYAVYDTRGSGEERGELSKPGKAFLEGFRDRLKALHIGGKVSAIPNPYPAVGVWSWSPLEPGERLNGFGAFLHTAPIGAYRVSEKEGERTLQSFIEKQIQSTCGQFKNTKIILLGYSQGAEATGNVYQGLSGSERRQIAAVVLWGDPRYNHTDKGADRDNRDLNGSLGTRAKFPDPSKVFSYCNAHDPICQWRLPLHQLTWYKLKEHSLYWKSKPPQAENHGRAVASFLAKSR